MSDPSTPDWMESSIQSLEGDVDGQEQATTENPDVNAGEEADAGEDPLATATPEKSAKKPADGKSGSPKPAQKADPATQGGQPLLDKQGRVVANGGFELRNLDRMPTTKQYIRTLQAEVESLTQSNASVAQAFQSFKDLNATPEEAVIGAKLLKELQSKPAETLQLLLQQAQARGITVLPKDKAGFDPALLRAMVDEAVRPLVSDREARVQEDQIATRARQETQAFFSAHPDAKIHESAIAQIVQHENVDPEHALTKLKLFCAERGLDWSKDLRAQVQARNGSNPSKDGARGSDKPLLNSGSGTVTPSRRTAVADANASWDAILGAVRNELRG